MRNLLTTLWVISLSTLVFGQQFPEPENFLITEWENDSISLSWSPPSEASPSHYNLYFCTFGPDDVIIKLETTSQTEAKFPSPDFAHTMCFGLSASYQNPIGESDTVYVYLSYPGILGYPHFFDFESTNENKKYLAVARNKGDDTWMLCNSTYPSPNHSAQYISNSIGNSATLWTLRGMFDTETSRNLSFWYKIPQNQGLSDTLSVHCGGSNMDTTLIQALYSSDEWQFARVSLDKVPQLFEIGFDAKAAGGNGIYLDDIRVFGETVSVEQQNFAMASVDIFPNPTSFFLNLNLNLSESADVKILLRSMEGKVIKTDLSRPMTPGMHRLTMDVSNLNPGIYLVSVQMKDKIINQKFIKL